MIAIPGAGSIEPFVVNVQVGQRYKLGITEKQGLS